MVEKTVKYYCDSCKKQLESENDFCRIEIIADRLSGFTVKEVCVDCYSKYCDKMIEIVKEMFD